MHFQDKVPIWTLKSIKNDFFQFLCYTWFPNHIVLFNFSERFPFKVISTACILKDGCEGILERWLSAKNDWEFSPQHLCRTAHCFPVLQFQRFSEARPLLASAGIALPCTSIPLAPSTLLPLHTRVQIIFKERLSYTNNSNYKEPPPLPCKVWYVDSPESS